jgi:hypothetical protein
LTDAPRGRRQPTEGVSGGPKLTTTRVLVFPAGQAPQRGADAVKAGYLMASARAGTAKL